MAVNTMSAQKAITNIEKKHHILVCLSASPSNETIVQTAAKMAKVLDARFTAIYVQNDFALTESHQKKLDNNIQFMFRILCRNCSTHALDQ